MGAAHRGRSPHRRPNKLPNSMPTPTKSPVENPSAAGADTCSKTSSAITRGAGDAKSSETSRSPGVASSSAPPASGSLESALALVNRMLTEAREIRKRLAVVPAHPADNSI